MLLVFLVGIGHGLCFFSLFLLGCLARLFLFFCLFLAPFSLFFFFFLFLFALLFPRLFLFQFLCGVHFLILVLIFHKLGGLVIDVGRTVVKDDRGIQAEAVDVAEHFGCGGVALVRLLLHGADRDLLQADRNGGIDLARTLGLLVELHQRHADSAVAVKRKLACEHLIEHNAHRIDVGFAVGHIAARLLGRDIVNRTDRLIGHGARRLVGEARNAEVRHLDGAVLQEHDVLRLDVAVNDAALVGVLQSAEHLCGEMQRILPLDHALALDVFLQGDTVDVLHHDILDHVAEAHVIHLDDIRV